MNYQWGSIFFALPNVVLVNSRTHEVELGLTELESQHQFLSLFLSLCVSLGFFQFLCSFFPLTFHPHSLLTCLQVHYTGYSNWSLQPFLLPSIIPRATSMGVCTSYAQDSVLRTRETTAMRSLHTTTRESPRVTMKTHHQIRSDQSLSHVRLFATP